MIFSTKLNCALEHKQYLLVGETANKSNCNYFLPAVMCCNLSKKCSVGMLIFLYLTCVNLIINFQIDEVKNIGSLPCLEKVVLSSNPLSIIPDYRTKVLAQFGDRASEVSHSVLLPLKLAPGKALLKHGK